MPSLKMRTKSTGGCARERNGLRVCQKSCIISKCSLSHVRISQQTSELETTMQSSQDVSFYQKVDVPEIEDNAQVCDRESLDGVQKQSPFLVDSANVGRMESTPAVPASHAETIFSPLLDSGDISQPSLHVDRGSIEHVGASPLGPDDSDTNRTSYECQTCNVSDFYISEMTVSGLPNGGSLVYNAITDGASLADYRCDEANLFFDVPDECLMLPFLEDTMETSNCSDGNKCDDANVDSDNSSLYLAIQQLTYNPEYDANNFSDLDLVDSFDPYMFIRSLPELPDGTPNFRSTISPKDTDKKSITLVLDLDETLVHSTLEHCDDADFTFKVFFNMKEHTVYVKQRPFLRLFLERVAAMFEIIVFTASQSIYAKKLLDILDPDGKLISRRAYHESCIFSDGSYTKDLTVLGVDLAKVAIIDNTPQVFRLQVNNGIPIKSWFDDPSDSALISLLPFLETLVDADDVRPIIAKKFGNKE